ncbi:METTL5 family protein [Nanoarchaeota archaeon]
MVQKIPNFSKSQLAILLSKLETFSDPKIKKEQYQTNPEVAAELIHNAFMFGDIKEKVIVDFGSGTGILGIGCWLMGAKKVTLIEQDISACEIAQKNIEMLKNAIESEHLESLKIGKIMTKRTNIKEYRGKSETLIMNPPFGVQQKHADREFYMKAFQTCDVIYSIGHSKSSNFVQKVSVDNGFKLTHKWEKSLILPKTAEFHTKSKKKIDIMLYRIEKVRNDIN